MQTIAITVDNTAPTIAVSDDDANNYLSAGDTATLTFTLSEASTDFVELDVTIAGGSLSNWTAISSTVYTATFTPNDNSTANGLISVSSSKFSDAAGNTNNDGNDANNLVRFFVSTSTAKPSTSSSPSKNDPTTKAPDSNVIDTVTGMPVTRLYSPKSDHHFMSTSDEAVDAMAASNKWIEEEYIFASPVNGGKAVHQFLNQNSGAHFYTTSEEEKNFIAENRSNTYSYLGVAFDAYSHGHGESNGKLAVFRYYNTDSESHVYSTDAHEQNILNKSLSHVNEGIAWYADFL